MLLSIPAGTQPTSAKMAILLSELQAMTSTTTERQSGHWIGIHTHKLRRLLGGNYREIVQDAIERGYVEENSRYAAGRFAKSYRLAKQFRVPKTVSFDAGCAKKPLAKIRIDDCDAVGRDLAACFDAVTIPANVAASGWDLYAVQSIHRHAFYATRCEYRRFHSSFTSLPKRIRSALRIGGKSVVEIDVANSQPLILGILAQSHPPTTTPPTTTPPHHRPTNTPTTICCTISEIQKYLELVSAGELYEHLLDKCSGLSLHDWIPIHSRHRYAANRPLRRSDVKRQFIVSMFSDNATMKRLPLFDIFAAEFPSIAAFMEQSKEREYQALARSCQRLESELIIDGVAAELVQKFPIVTIHDSIIAPAANADHVANSIRDRFSRFGVSVTTSGAAA